MVPVSHLPDLVLKALFRQMTLQDQIGARKVCRRWADLVLEVTSKRREFILLLGRDSIEEFEDIIDETLFKNREALKLLLKADGTPLYPTRRFTSWNSLHMDSLDQATVDSIGSSFTGANNLQAAVLDTSPYSLIYLAHLLSQWSGQLVTVQLFEDNDQFDYSNLLGPLLVAINTLSALKRLHLYLHNLPVLVMSIVSQLEELYFYSEDAATAEPFAQVLQQYGEGNRALTRIECHINCMPRLEPFTALSEHLRHRFTSLDFHYNRDLATLSGHFPSLTTLFLFPADITVRQLFTQLSTLRQLIHLNLAIASFPVDDLEHHLLLPQVKSVKALEVMLVPTMPTHQEVAKMKISWTLPNLEVIRFVLFGFRCAECHIDSFGEPSEQAKSCLRQLFAPLKRGCTKLRLIQYNKEQVHGTADELLAK